MGKKQHLRSHSRHTYPFDKPLSTKSFRNRFTRNQKKVIKRLQLKKTKTI